MNQLVFESQRLLFKEFNNNDIDLIFNLNTDPEVTKFTGDLIKSIEEAKHVLQNVIIPQYALYGHGRWAVFLKSSNEFIGWCGLKYLIESDEIDLGYRFMQPFWNKGYATEGAKATLNYGFNNLNLKIITGRAMPKNLYSIKVLEKCGMKFEGYSESHGHLAATYRIVNELNYNDKK